MMQQQLSSSGQLERQQCSEQLAQLRTAHGEELKTLKESAQSNASKLSAQLQLLQEELRTEKQVRVRNPKHLPALTLHWCHTGGREQKQPLGVAQV